MSAPAWESWSCAHLCSPRPEAAGAIPPRRWLQAGALASWPPSVVEMPGRGPVWGGLDTRSRADRAGSPWKLALCSWVLQWVSGCRASMPPPGSKLPEDRGSCHTHTRKVTEGERRPGQTTARSSSHPRARSTAEDALEGRRAGQRAQLVDRTPRPVWAQEAGSGPPSPHASPPRLRGSPAPRAAEPHPHGRLIRGWNGSADERTEGPVCPHGDEKEGHPGATGATARMSPARAGRLVKRQTQEDRTLHEAPGP